MVVTIAQDGDDRIVAGDDDEARSIGPVIDVEGRGFGGGTELPLLAAPDELKPKVVRTAQGTSLQEKAAGESFCPRNLDLLRPAEWEGGKEEE